MIPVREESLDDVILKAVNVLFDWTVLLGLEPHCQL